ncbi:hypothetical protein ACFE04_010920 [Oxalis oulophora]
MEIYFRTKYLTFDNSFDGDIIDCVKLTDQPAFDHHLLKNHTIQNGNKASKSVRNPSLNYGNLVEVVQMEAVAYVRGGKYFGARGNMDAWNPRNNGYKTVCYNIQGNCPGFVQVTKGLAIGVVLKPLSIYSNSKTMALDLSIWQDHVTGNWWLKADTENIGYFPKSLFNHLQKGASMVTWGGRIKNNNYHSSHTTTQMGSGHFSNEGFGKVSLISDIYIIDEHKKSKQPSLVDHMTRRGCYDIKHINTSTGMVLYFGGPGKNKYC